MVTWDLTQVGRMVRRSAATIPIACGACPEPTLAISPDRAFATAEAENNRVTVLNLGPRTESFLDRDIFEDRILLSWYGPAHDLVGADLRRGTVDIIDAVAPTGPRRLGTDPTRRPTRCDCSPRPTARWCTSVRTRYPSGTHGTGVR